MAENQLPDERPQRRREYSGPGSTLGLAALVVIVVGVGIWYFEFRGSAASSGVNDSGLGIIDLPSALNPTDEAPAARGGRAAPNFELAALDETVARLADYRGKYVLVNFWASWCPPCREETPDLQSFYEHNRETLMILGVNQQERPEAVSLFVNDYGVTYPVLLDSSGEVSQAYGVGRGMPITYVVAPDGVIEKVYFGRLTEDNFAEIEAKLQ